jgi:hypothetical protein
VKGQRSHAPEGAANNVLRRLVSIRAIEREGRHGRPQSPPVNKALFVRMKAKPGKESEV